MSYPESVYFGDTGETIATLRPATGEADILMESGVRVSYLTTAAQSAGEFGLYRWDFGDQATGPAPHFHRSISESFFVLSGIVTLFDGAQEHETGPGDFLFVPKGGIHSFRNDHGPASMLILFTPGAPREGYFELLGEVAAGRLAFTPEEWVAICKDNDQFYPDTAPR
ncbi:cupin domain-containing protein [Mycolicibacterium sp.]|uniref:cupin domain-containing protein n=1 Tax=Mycolicibacterium sp. TaxID=2320850 RepID=UPI001A21F95D|nr:cupin domain-containing protein [Mycolicibacterium sp.]MBJ7400223.1 cupin domain-containing protein [Mycolicibacterium sp.]